MKAIILGTLAATMITGVAKAACNDIPNPTRFNPQELSAYQECWLDEYKAEETAGVLGSLAWIRVDGQYFSASLSAIRSMKGTDYADKFFAAIENDMLEVVRSDAEERMVEITTIIIDGGEYSDEEYLILKELREADSIEHAQAIITLTKAHEMALEAGKASAYGAGKAAMKIKLDTYYGTKIEQININHANAIAFLEDRIDRIKSAAGFTGTEFYGSDGLLQHLKTINWKAGKYEGLVTQVANLTTVNLAQANMLISKQSDIVALTTKINNAKAVSNDTTWTGTLTIPTPSADSLVGGNNSWDAYDLIEQAVDDGDWYGAEGIQTKLEAAFAENYDRGYADGYADGFEDGYEAGVDAVQAQL